MKAPDNIATLIQGYGVLDRLHGLLDQGHCELEAAIGKPICIESCGKCCEHNTPVVSRLEAQYIISGVAILPGFKRVINQALDWLAFNHADLDSNSHHPAEVLQAKQCPFLDADKTCMIYSVRPLVCHAYGVIIPQDDWCPRPLHYSESSPRRMIIGRDTKLGRVIADIRLPEKSVYFLPTLIAQIAASDRFRTLNIQPAKLVAGEGYLDLFYRQRIWDALDRGLS